MEIIRGLNKKQLWDKTVEFHGHICGGLTIGYMAALLAVDLLELEFSADEQVVCVSENDACGVDAIQVILGCSIGKGNLLFHMTGKQAFSFYERKNGKSVRLVLNPQPQDIPRAEMSDYLLSHEPSDLFEVKDTFIEIPERAHLFESYTCEKCGEQTGANWIRIHDGKKLCLDCFPHYDRFRIGFKP